MTYEVQLLQPILWCHPMECGKFTLRKNDSLFRQQLSATNSSSVGSETWRSPMPGFWLAWSGSGNPSCCKFVSTIAMSCTEDGTSHHPSPPWLFLFSFCDISCALGIGADNDVSVEAVPTVYYSQYVDQLYIWCIHCFPQQREASLTKV